MGREIEGTPVASLERDCTRDIPVTLPAGSMCPIRPLLSVNQIVPPEATAIAPAPPPVIGPTLGTRYSFMTPSVVILTIREDCAIQIEPSALLAMLRGDSLVRSGNSVITPAVVI